MTDVSIVIASYNTKDLLIDCIRSIYDSYTKSGFEIIIVDNASIDGSVTAIKALGKKNIKLIQNSKNLGFARANNQGIKITKGKYILLLNSDTKFTENVLDFMVEWFEKHPKAGIATCKLLNSNKTIQATGGYFPTLSRVAWWMIFQDFPLLGSLVKPFHPKGGFYQKEKEVDWVTGAFLMARSEVLEKINGFDESYFMYGEDIDMCYRAKKANWEVWFVTGISIIHYGGASSNREYPILSEFKGIKTFYKKHYQGWQYPILRMLLKIGALGRAILFGILKGGSSAKIYGKAFVQA